VLQRLAEVAERGHAALDRRLAEQRLAKLQTFIGELMDIGGIIG
jgi:hypothetical protein